MYQQTAEQRAAALHRAMASSTIRGYQRQEQQEQGDVHVRRKMEVKLDDFRILIG